MTDNAPFEIIDAGRMPYAEALALQKDLVAAKKNGESRDYLLLVEHPPVITLGRTAKESHVLFSTDELKSHGIEVHAIERGGDVTYHAPGQLVGYPVVDLRRAGLGVREYLRFLESVIIDVLDTLGIEGFAREGLTGVWTARGKVAAIGVAVTRWISFHGFALNVATDLAGFDSIVPCGIRNERVTSIREILGAKVSVEDVKGHIAAAFGKHLAARRNSNIKAPAGSL